ncbi:hypothetical protein ACFVZZ_14595 [Streptomyces chartreusis]|uniref:hypothetical protein n=1 Tax=Streptomyces chartreusis TaxID=1969 RepID=UPI0036D920E2
MRQTEQIHSRAVQPYPAGTLFTFRSRESGYAYRQELVLAASPAIGDVIDADVRGAQSALVLWPLWAADAHLYHERWPDSFRPGEIPISWTVMTRPGTEGGIYERAPFHPDERRLPGLPMADEPTEDFLTFHTEPLLADNEERMNWLRLEVLDRAWNETGADRGGFIQEATGWKPSPLQAIMNVIDVARAAGVWAPPLP